MKRFSFLILMLMFASTFALGQTETGYQERLVYPIRIILLDTKDQPVPNAEVILFTPQETIATAKTNAEGKASLIGIKDGDYDLLFKLDNGTNVLFNNQWMETKQENEHIYHLLKKETKAKKKHNE